MSEKGEPSPSDAKRLEYWHSAERPISSLRLAISFSAGFLTASISLFVVAGLCVGMLGGITKGEFILLVELAIWGGCFIVSIINLIGFARAHRALSIDQRRQPYRFSQLGALIGFGVAALLGGICFGIASV